jgi:DNA-binding winged helix-turn-helix (wHTH) protein/tetratricopeptide (TPR) repeat protein
MLDGGWRFGPYELHVGVDRVLRGQKRIQLTETEFKLLASLVAHGGETVSREALLAAVWSVQMTEDHTLTMHMFRLRQEFGEAIIPPSERGGYRIGVPIERMATPVESLALRLCVLFVDAEEKRQRMPDADWDAAYLGHSDDVRASLDWALAVSGRRHIAIRLAGASGRIWQRLPALPEGRRYLDRAVELIDEDVRLTDAARALYHAGILLREVDRPRSLALFDRTASLYRRLQDKAKLGDVLGLIGDDQLFLGFHDSARASLREAEKLLAITDQSKALYNVFNSMGILAAMQKAPQEATEYFSRARDIARLLNDAVREHVVTLNIGELEFLQGAVDRAIARATEAMEGFRTAPATYRVRPIVNLAIYEAMAGNLRKSKKVAKEALPLASAQGGHWLRLCLQVWAFLAAQSGQTIDAARLTGYVEAQFIKIGEIRDAPDQLFYDRLIAKLRASLTKESLNVWLREGAAWTEAQAVQCVNDRLAITERRRA